MPRTHPACASIGMASWTMLIVLQLVKLLIVLIAADRTGDWEGHLDAVENLLPIFRGCDSINYLRYATS